jgi:hypothetical protein
VINYSDRRNRRRGEEMSEGLKTSIYNLNQPLQSIPPPGGPGPTEGVGKEISGGKEAQKERNVH